MRLEKKVKNKFMKGTLDIAIQCTSMVLLFYYFRDTGDQTTLIVDVSDI